jgi:cytochrome c oxidase subunit 2
MLENSPQTDLERAMQTLITMLRPRVLPLGLLLLAAGCDYKVPTDQATASGEEMFQLCSQCHGAAGEGHREYNAPSIAGLPEWYVEAQLTKFRTGVRGTHPSDVTGMMMRPMTRSFHNQADLKAVAAYVASLPRPVTHPALTGGDAANGKALYAVCAACHQPDGSGQQLVKAPPLKQASDWYLLAQLEKFRAGVRGGTPRDVEGSTMRPMAASLASDQAVKDVVAYIATLK